MAYRQSYRRGGYRSAPTTGRIAKVNARPGPCRYCQEEIPANGGQLWREESGTWSVVHRPAEWAGSPVSGRYVGGCPDETDKMNAQGNFGPGAGDSEHNRIASRAALASAITARSEAPRDSRGGYADECGSCGMASCAC